MVVIRLSRGGSKKSPFYNVVVADSRNRREVALLSALVFTTHRPKLLQKAYVLMKPASLFGQAMAHNCQIQWHV